MFLEVNSLLMFIDVHIDIDTENIISYKYFVEYLDKSKSNLISDPHDKDGQGQYETDQW